MFTELLHRLQAESVLQAHNQALRMTLAAPTCSASLAWAATTAVLATMSGLHGHLYL